MPRDAERARHVVQHLSHVLRRADAARRRIEGRPQGRHAPPRRAAVFSGSGLRRRLAPLPLRSRGRCGRFIRPRAAAASATCLLRRRRAAEFKLFDSRSAASQKTHRTARATASPAQLLAARCAAPVASTLVCRQQFHRSSLQLGGVLNPPRCTQQRSQRDHDCSQSAAGSSGVGICTTSFHHRFASGAKQYLTSSRHLRTPASHRHAPVNAFNNINNCAASATPHRPSACGQTSDLLHPFGIQTRPWPSQPQETFTRSPRRPRRRTVAR